MLQASWYHFPKPDLLRLIALYRLALVQSTDIELVSQEIDAFRRPTAPDL